MTVLPAWLMPPHFEVPVTYGRQGGAGRISFLIAHDFPKFVKAE
jgi:hypothetical protein